MDFESTKRVNEQLLKKLSSHSKNYKSIVHKHKLVPKNTKKSSFKQESNRNLNEAGFLNSMVKNKLSKKRISKEIKESRNKMKNSATHQNSRILIL